jgi:hypothetical protein
LWNPVVGVVRRNYLFCAPARPHPFREGDELIERFAPPIVEAHIRVFFAPSSSPWIAVALYLGPVLSAGVVRREQDYRSKASGSL